MKTSITIAALLLAACTASAEPVKWLDGTVTEATAWKLNPSTVELTTAHGKITVPVGKLDAHWLAAKFPNGGHAQITRELAKIQRELEETMGVAAKVLADNKRLTIENAQLRAQLAKYGTASAKDSPVAITEVGVRKLKEQFGHVSYSWKARLTNHTTQPIKNLGVRLSGRDAEEFEVFHDFEAIELAPGESKLLTFEAITPEHTWRSYKKAVVTTD